MGALHSSKQGQQYISLEQFSKLIGKTESTIKRRRTEIPGVEYVDGVWEVLEGTRFPFKIRSCSITDDEDRRRVLLSAISTYRYIDAKMLGVYPKTFENYLGDLLQANLIRENGSPNRYGANYYDCTPEGSKIAKLNKEGARSKLANLVSSCIGTFSGAIYSEIFGQVG